MLFGCDVAESGPRFFTVMFDDGISSNVACNSLKICSSLASLPPSEHPLVSRTSAARRAAVIAKQLIGEEDADNNEEEDDEYGDPENKRSNKDEGGSHQDGQVAIDRQATGDGLAIETASGGVFIGEGLPTNYHRKLTHARNKISGILGQMIQKDTFIWTMIAEHHKEALERERESTI